MHVVAYLRPSTMLWYLLMILARLRDDILSLTKLVILRFPLSYVWSKTNNLVFYINNATRDLTKIPKHISFIVMEDDVDVATLSEAVVWCIILGISCISIADKQGLLSRHKHQLDQLVSRRLAQLNLPARATFYQPPSVCAVAQPPVSNSSPQLHANVAILSPSAGRRLLAAATVLLAASAGDPAPGNGRANPTQSVASSRVTVAQLDQTMHDLSGLVDADLAFRLGRTDSLFLPSPWHFRLAEFYQVDSQRALTAEAFIDGLKFYSRVDQRLGK